MATVSYEAMAEAQAYIVDWLDAYGNGLTIEDFDGDNPIPPFVPADVRSAWDTVKAFWGQTEAEEILI